MLFLRTFLPLTSKIGVLAQLSSFKVSDVKELMGGGGLQILESEVLDGSIPSYFAVAQKG